MPNNPLSTFRAVEPPFAGFQAAAGLASVPFVLYHQRIGPKAASGTVQTAQASTATALQADRFLPWLHRSYSEVYPAAIPNAYDRVYIFPMVCLDTTPGDNGGTSVPTVAFMDAVTGWVPPMIIPYGLLPETRGQSDSGKLSKTRFPDDLVSAIAPSATLQHSTRTNGLWMPLQAYASNFTTSNQQITAASSTYLSSVPRNLVTSAGIGNGYMLPRDAAISYSSTSAGTSATPVVSPYTASVTGPIIGAGLEFTLSGCQELVVALASSPTYPTITINAQTASTFGSVSMNMFLMGVFLG